MLCVNVADPPQDCAASNFQQAGLSLTGADLQAASQCSKKQVLSGPRCSFSLDVLVHVADV